MKNLFDVIDRQIAGYMYKIGLPALRISLGIIFIWFGVLKTIGLSPAEGLVLATVNWMPVFSAGIWLSVIGWWEVVIGVCFLFKPTLRIAIGLLALQMAGTFLPLIILTDVTFQAGHFPYAPTMEGQYIIKNLLIISAAIVVGGSVRKD
ncbi:MAG: hypothetical protein JJU37_16740 [Balneolaceae bacterium]|nr:hypothetical protein [Balneolaceae bacterium]